MKLLQEQKQQDQINRRNEMMDDYVANFQSQLDKKKKEIKLDELKKQLPETGKEEDEEEENSSTPVKESSSVSSTVPEVNRSSKPFFDRSTKPSISLLDNSDGDGLRKLIVPFKTIVDKFTNLAQNNTSLFFVFTN